MRYVNKNKGSTRYLKIVGFVAAVPPNLMRNVHPPDKMLDLT